MRRSAPCATTQQALVDCTGGGDDHLALAPGQPAFFLEHQRIVAGEERAPLGRAPCKGQKDVGDETGFLLYGKDARADVFGQGVQVGKRVARVHGVSLARVGVAPS